MIVSHASRFVFYAPPKTASSTLHEWLSQPAFCPDRYVATPSDEQHRMDAPTEAAEYFTFASIRHPLDRCVSLWAHSQRPSDRAPRMGFREFVLSYQKHCIWWYRDSMSKIFRDVRIDAYVRFDRLEADLFSLPPVVACIATGQSLEPLPSLNGTTHPPWREVVTADLEAVIRERWAEDWTLADWDARDKRTTGDTHE